MGHDRPRRSTPTTTTPTFNEVVFPAAILQPPSWSNAAMRRSIRRGRRVIGREIGGMALTTRAVQSDTPACCATVVAGRRGRAGVHQRVDRLDAAALGSRRCRRSTLNGCLDAARTIGDLGGLSVANAGVSPRAARRFGAGARRPDRRPALLPVLAQVSAANSVTRGFAFTGHEQSPQPGEIPRQRRGAQRRCLVPAFKVQPGEKLYCSPDERVHIW